MSLSDPLVRKTACFTLLIVTLACNAGEQEHSAECEVLSLQTTTNMMAVGECFDIEVDDEAKLEECIGKMETLLGEIDATELACEGDEELLAEIAEARENVRGSKTSFELALGYKRGEVEGIDAAKQLLDMMDDAE